MSEESPCPRCGKPTAMLKSIQTGMKLALQATDMADLPPEVCLDCYQELNSQVSHGAKLRAEMMQKEKNRQMMWKNRVKVVKQARLLMSQKAYGEAATSYEKYLRIIEVVHDLKKGELNPEIFSHSKKSKEMTVVTSTYWDLFRIYDQSAAYNEKMRQTGDKLAQFVKFSAIYPDIMRKAENFYRTARHPGIVKEFIRKAGGKKGACFIATSVFEDPYSWEILVLRRFRDQKLRKYRWGRRLIYVYYKMSPKFAAHIKNHPKLQVYLRLPLRVIAWIASLSLKRGLLS